MTTAAPEAPAPTGEAPQEPATPAPSETPAAPPAPPETPPPAAPETPAEPEKLESVNDLGDGPDGDPVEGESPLDKIKRIARREAKEKRAIEQQATEARDRATTLEQELSDVKASAARLPEVETKLNEALGKLQRIEIGATKGLTPSQSMRLQGSTAEELEADLARYIAENAIPTSTDRSSGPSTAAEERALIERMNRNRT